MCRAHGLSRSTCRARGVARWRHSSSLRPADRGPARLRVPFPTRLAAVPPQVTQGRSRRRRAQHACSWTAEKGLGPRTRLPRVAAGVGRDASAWVRAAGPGTSPGQGGSGVSSSCNVARPCHARPPHLPPGRGPSPSRGTARTARSQPGPGLPGQQRPPVPAPNPLGERVPARPVTGRPEEGRAPTPSPRWPLRHAVLETGRASRGGDRGARHASAARGPGLASPSPPSPRRR